MWRLLLIKAFVFDMYVRGAGKTTGQVKNAKSVDQTKYVS
jgi:hypothetical protein